MQKRTQGPFIITNAIAKLKTRSKFSKNYEGHEDVLGGLNHAHGHRVISAEINIPIDIDGQSQRHISSSIWRISSKMRSSLGSGRMLPAR